MLLCERNRCDGPPFRSGCRGAIVAGARTPTQRFLMQLVSTRRRSVAAIALLLPFVARAQGAKRPITFLDVQEMRSASAPAISPNGQWGLYSITTPDWKTDKRQSDLYVVSTAS